MGILVLKMTIEESVGGKITEGAMEAPSVGEGLEVIEKRNGGGAFGVEGEAVAEGFRLKGSKGAFRKSVVITIAFGAHALAQTMSGEQLAGDGGGVLAAAIGVKDCSRGTRPDSMARVVAPTTRSACRESESFQPRMARENRSMTTARKSQPSLVGM